MILAMIKRIKVEKREPCIQKKCTYSSTPFFHKENFHNIKIFYSESEIHASKEISEKEHTIRKLINENKLSIIYDKLPSSYTGYRPYIACGVPTEKKETY